MDLLVLSEVKWNYLRTRKRFLLRHFPRNSRILFLQPISFSLANNFLPKRDGNILHMSTPVLKPHTESSLYNRFTQFSVVRDFLDLIIVLWVRMAMLLLRFRTDVAVLISSIYFVPVVEHLRGSFVCYDCNDDPTAFPGVKAWALQYLRRLCKRANVIVACSESLATRIGSACKKDPVVVGNGVDYELFAREVASDEIPEDIASVGQPVVGYTGAIKEWFDFQLVASTALENPEISFVLIGPVAPPVEKEARELEENLRNVRFLGEKDYEALPSYLAPMKVCMIPFKRGPLTSVLNPNKLYEYFAAGKTVVSLRYSDDMAKYEGLMYLVEDATQFGRGISDALREPVDPRKVREVASVNSWTSKAHELIKVFEAGERSGGCRS